MSAAVIICAERMGRTSLTFTINVSNQWSCVVGERQFTPNTLVRTGLQVLQARFVKTVNIHECGSKPVMGKTVGVAM